MGARLAAGAKAFWEEIASLDGAQWMVAIMSLILSVPWVLFVDSEIFAVGLSATAFGGWLIICFLAAFAFSLQIVAIWGAKRLLAANRRVNDAAAIAFSLGLGLLVLAGYLPDGAAALCPGMRLVGAFMAGLGYGALFVIAMLPCSRFAPLTTACLAVLSTVFSALIVLLVQLLIAPIGVVAFLVAMTATFLAAPRAAAISLPMPSGISDVLAKNDVFVLIDKRKMYAMVGLLCFEGLLCLMQVRTELPDVGFLLVAIVVLCSALAAVVVVMLSSGRYRSVTLSLFVVSFAGILFGSVAMAVMSTGALSLALVVLGCTFLIVFYPPLYSGLCKRKDFSDARSSENLGKTAMLLPLFSALAGIAHMASLSFGGAVCRYACLLGGAALVVVLLAMFSEELLSTRRDLALKQDSAISLKDVLRFADETKAEFHLTERECEVIQQIMSGRSVAAAADELYLSESTVKTHMRSIYKKLDVHNRQEMIRLINGKLH